MKTKIFSAIFLCAVGLLATSCNNQKENFSEDETTLINKYHNAVMRTLTIDNSNDSMFLRQTAKEISNSDLQSPIFEQLKTQMLATVRDTVNPGVGIAAPQVGISRRLVAVQRFDKAGEPFEFYANPRITYFSEQKQTGAEGCLSVPNLRGTVERAKKIAVKYIDTKTLKPCIDTVCDFTAVIFQHEIDHLDGVLYIDRASKIEKE